MQGDIDAQPTAVPSTGRDWSAFGCAGVGCITFAVFAVAQLVAMVVVIVRAHPDLMAVLMHDPPQVASATVQRWVIDTSTAPNLFLYAVVGDGAMVLMALVLARAFLGASLRDLGLRMPAIASQMALGLAVGIVLVVASDIVAAIQAKLVGEHSQVVVEIMKSHKGMQNFILDLASVCLIAPFAEETLFRGVIFTGLQRWMPVTAAAVVSGLIFACAHADQYSILPLAVVGTGLALFYRYTGSLIPNMIAHATFNGVALVVVYFLPKLAT